MTGIRPPAPSPVPKTAPPPESKWMLERGGVSDRLETEGTRGEAEAKQPRGAGIPEIPEAVHRDPLAAGSTQPRFQLSPDKTSPDDHIQHRKAQADDSPSLAAKQVEIHVHNKGGGTIKTLESKYGAHIQVTRHDIPEGEISKKAYVGLPENKQIKVERSMTVEISNEVTRHDIPEGEISKKSYVGLPENEQIKVERSMTMEISNQVTRHDISEGEISKNSYVGLPENKQIKVERSMTMEISNQVQKAMENIGLISVWKTVAV